MQEAVARPSRPEPYASAAVRASEPPAAGRDLHGELAELRAMVRGLSSRISGTDPSVLRQPYVEPEFTAAPTDPAVSYLRGFGLSRETAQVVARFTRDTIVRAGSTTSGDLNAIFQAAIARLFTTAELFPARPGRQQRISLIGPTGVGKTTTLATATVGFTPATSPGVTRKASSTSPTARAIPSAAAVRTSRRSKWRRSSTSTRRCWSRLPSACRRS